MKPREAITPKPDSPKTKTIFDSKAACKDPHKSTIIEIRSTLDHTPTINNVSKELTRGIAPLHSDARYRQEIIIREEKKRIA